MHNHTTKCTQSLGHLSWWCSWTQKDVNLLPIRLYLPWKSPHLSELHCNNTAKKTSNRRLYISRPPAFTMWHLAPSDHPSVSAVFSPVVGSNPIPSGDGRINTSLVICVAYVLTLDRDQQSLGPSRSDHPPAALHSTWVPSEARGWGEIMKRTLVWPLNQLDDCKSKEAGQGVRAVGAAPTVVCVNRFWSLDLITWSLRNQGAQITRMQNTHSEQSPVYGQKSQPKTIVMETRF